MDIDEVGVDSSNNDDTYAMGSSGIDSFALQELAEQHRELSEIPLLKEALDGLNMVLLSCGDTNGFLADNISDAIASLSAFCLIVNSNPVEFIIQLNGGDKAKIADTIEALNLYAAELYAAESTNSSL